MQTKTVHNAQSLAIVVVAGLSPFSAAFPQEGLLAEPSTQRAPRFALQACRGLLEGNLCELHRRDGGVISGRCESVQAPDGTRLACKVTAEPQALSYPVVDTAQRDCFSDLGQVMSCPQPGDPLYGQDAQHQGLLPQYLVNSDGTVTDQVTGLMWQRSSDTNQDGVIDYADELTYEEALAHCEMLNLAGYGDWRLPDIKTLYSLIDFNGIDPYADGTETLGLEPFINDEVFEFAYGDLAAGERIIDAQYASSTLYVSELANRGRTLFGVNFADGRIKGYGINMPHGEKTFSVLCVRGNPSYGINDFVEQGDGTVVDRATGLMWTQADSSVDMPNGLNWQQALAWVQERNAEGYLGYDDWRLPHAKELQSIVDYSRSPDTTGSPALAPVFEVTPIINEAGQPDYAAVWTSTTHQNWTEMPGLAAAYVTFGRGMGYMQGAWVDVHGAGAQRSDPKQGDPAAYPFGRGPQGDAIRIYNDVRLVRNAEIPQL